MLLFTAANRLQEDNSEYMEGHDFSKQKAESDLLYTLL